MAAGRTSMLAVMLIAGLLQSASAATYTVGGAQGWTFAASPTFYDEWAQQQTFVVGDELRKSTLPHYSTVVVSHLISSARPSVCVFLYSVIALWIQFLNHSLQLFFTAAIL